MTSVSSRRTHKEVSARVLRARSVAFFLDYDGTLSPIRRTPLAAVLPRSAAKLLRELAGQEGISLTIVTGRSYNDIRRLVNDPRIACIANHGFHVVDRRGGDWTHPAARRSKGHLKALCSAIDGVISEYQGAFVENKELTASVHYRKVRSHRVPKLRSSVLALLRSNVSRFRVLNGKKVIDIRPAATWGKGHAVLRSLRRSGNAKGKLVIYIGDDVTDEDAFKALRSRGITIKVGHSRNTAARYSVRNTAEVRNIFRGILTAWKGRATAA